MNRISKENYYLNIAQTVLERATCLRRVYGAIIVKNDEIISIARNEEKDDESAESGESAEKTESAEHGTNATVNEGASASSEAATEANAGNGDGENVEA